MGRMAAHTGNTVTFEQMLNCPHEMAPDVVRLRTLVPKVNTPLLADIQAAVKINTRFLV